MRRSPALAAGAAVALLAAVAVGSSAARGADEPGPRASADLSPAVAGVDDLVTFSLTVEASGFGGVTITPAFELDNLEIAAGPFQSRSQRWVNGVTSSSVQLTWRLRPKGVGPARVREIRVAASGQTLALADREIAVQQESPHRAAPQPARSTDPFEDFFARSFPEARRDRRPATRVPKLALRAEVTPAEVFVGQQATYTLWLYTQSDISAFQPTKVPDFQGFWVREIPQPQELKPEWVDLDGERYGRVPMLRRAIFPLKDGRFRIDPTEVDVVARIADFGPFGSPFGRNESFHLATDPATLVAKPLPPGAAPDFAGPVGEVAISARLDRTALDVGQAATLTVRATGRGNLQSLAAPHLDLPAGVRGFPPRQESSERLTDGVLVSSTEWAYVLVPERPGTFPLAEIRLPYFDPAKREYRVASAAPPALAVAGIAVPEPAPAAPAATAEAAPAGTGAPTDTPSSSAAALRRWVPIGAGAVAAAGLAAFLLRRRSSDDRAASRRALASAIEQAGRAGSPRTAAAELEEAWRAHLAKRWNVPPGTPVSGWSDRLAAAGADASAAAKLADLARELHYLRYAPELSAADPLLADALETSHRLARSLR